MTAIDKIADVIAQFLGAALAGLLILGVSAMGWLMIQWVKLRDRIRDLERDVEELKPAATQLRDRGDIELGFEIRPGGEDAPR